MSLVAQDSPAPAGKPTGSPLVLLALVTGRLSAPKRHEGQLRGRRCCHGKWNRAANYLSTRLANRDCRTATAAAAADLAAAGRLSCYCRIC